MVTFSGHGMLKNYSCKIEIKQPESLVTVIRQLMLPELIEDDTIFVRQHSKLEYDSIISDQDEIHMFMATFGG